MGLSGYCVARQHIVGTGKQGCNHTVHKFDVTRWCFNDSTTVPSVGSGFFVEQPLGVLRNAAGADRGILSQ